MGSIQASPDPIVRGQKLAVLAAEVTMAAGAIPFRPNTLAQSIRLASRDMKPGKAIMPKMNRQPAAQQYRGIGGLGKQLQRKTEGLADWLSNGNGEEYIQNDFLLSTVRGIGAGIRNASIKLNPRAAKKQASIQKA